MKAPVFPIFALRTRNGLVIAGGGGGDKKFGKMNGVVVLDATTTKDLAYYETSDIILDICVWDPAEDVEEPREDDMSWDEYDEEIRVDSAKDSSEQPEESTEATQTLYLTCCGEQFFYVLRLCSLEFVLVKRIEKRISSQMFAKDLYVVHEKALLGIHDVVRNPDALDDLLKPERRRKKINNAVLGDESHEEYVYRLFRKNRRIVFKREDGRSDIVSNWEGVFMTPGMVHKIVVEDGRFSFVFNSKRYSYDREIGQVLCVDGVLVYYLKGKDSALYFQGDSEKIHHIPQITALGWNGEHVTVGTGDGHAYLFHGHVLMRRKRVCGVPITGIGYMDGHVYFTSINGLINRSDMSRRRLLPYLLLALAVLLMSFLVGRLIARHCGSA